MTDSEGSEGVGSRPIPEVASAAVDNINVGVDMGGTKTRLQARGAHGLIADVTVPSRGVMYEDYARTGEALASLVRRALGGDLLPAAVAVGAHGCDSPAQCSALREQIVRHLPVPCTVVNDAQLLLSAAGLSSGVAVVAGTGSVAVGHTAEGEVLQAGGWGWLLGDEGGAAGIVRHAARTCLARADKGLDDDELSRRLQEAFGVSSVSDLAQVMERTGGASGWGSHAAVVFSAADAGCLPAIAVIDEAGESLAALVRTLRDRGADVGVVVVAGGVIVRQSRLQDAFVRSLRMDLADSRVVVLTEPPVIGAVKIAISQASGPVAAV